MMKKLMKMIQNIKYFFSKKEERYCREWLMQAGWGVMIGMDVIWAKSIKEATKGRPRQGYTDHYEKINRVPKHLKTASDDDIIRYFGGLP